ncbi:MAG: hypothetical protein ACOYNC_05290, partial [Bacteroidales bacterium]
MNKKINSNEVKFYLKNKSKGKGTIFAIFNFGYKEDGSYRNVQISTGEHIEVRFWVDKPFTLTSVCRSKLTTP